MLGLFVEKMTLYPAFVPIDTTGAAQTGPWVNLKFHRNLAIAILQGAWAGGTPAVTVEQATDSAGTGAKSVTFNKKYSGLFGTTGDAGVTDVLTEATVTSNTFNLPATANTFTVIDLIGETDLDIANGFYYARALVASPGSNADLIAGFYVLYNSGYVGRPSTLPTNLTG